MKIDKDMGSILGPELKIDGDVSVSGSLLIYGTVNGSIRSQASVRSARGSVVKGDIIAEEAQIHGLVKGDLIVGNDEHGNGGEKFDHSTFACRPPGIYHGPFKSDNGCTLFELHYYKDGKNF